MPHESSRLHRRTRFTPAAPSPRSPTPNMSANSFARTSVKLLWPKVTAHFPRTLSEDGEGDRRQSSINRQSTIANRQSSSLHLIGLFQPLPEMLFFVRVGGDSARQRARFVEPAVQAGCVD